MKRGLTSVLQTMSKFVPRLMLGVALALALTLSGTPLAVAGDGDHQKGLATANAVPAKELFGAVKEPAPVSARAIGFYSHGCLAGAVALPVSGPAWQVMRLSRNRNWAHPALLALIEKLAEDAQAKDGWPGLLVGDISQPRGGPMLTGHASHQIGLDADIWLTPKPARTLSTPERETMSATNVVRGDRLDVNRAWTADSMAVVRLAAQDPR